MPCPARQCADMPKWLLCACAQGVGRWRAAARLELPESVCRVTLWGTAPAGGIPAMEAVEDARRPSQPAASSWRMATMKMRDRTELANNDDAWALQLVTWRSSTGVSNGIHVSDGQVERICGALSYHRCEHGCDAAVLPWLRGPCTAMSIGAVGSPPSMT